MRKKIGQRSAGQGQKVLNERSGNAERWARGGRRRAYLDSYQEALSYDRFKAAGYATGAGQVQSAPR